MGALLLTLQGSIAVLFVGVLVDANRAADVLSFGLGAGALVFSLGFFAASASNHSERR